MKALWTAAGIALVVLLGCQSPPPSARSLPADRSEVEAVLRRFSDALATGDADALRRWATPNFTLLEEGRVYNLQETVDSVRHVLALGRLIRTPTGFEITVSGNTAWAHYKVLGDFTAHGSTTKLHLLEATVLQRNGRHWQVALMATLPQSTP